MKMSALNGWSLIGSLNNETRQIDDVICEIQDHNRRRAALHFMQHKLLKESTEPQTGIFFWVPWGDGWRLETFFDSQFPSTGSIELDHARIWSKWANTLLGKDESNTPRAILHSYSGIPRGRVTKTIVRKFPGGPNERIYLVLHGNDAPMRNAGKIIASRFYLPDGRWKFAFDDHERMTKDDVLAIQRYLGRDLGLLKKAAQFN